MIAASTWPVVTAAIASGALGEAPDLGGVGLVLGVGLAGGPVLGADDLAGQVVDRGMSEPSGTTSACWAL